jgi:5'-methylthioadenosine phosphorylase
VLHHKSPESGKDIAIAFLSRHGLHHEIAPHEVPARANIAALRSLGVRTIIAFSAVGSLQEEIKPRDFVVPDQVIDRTKGIRPFTFFEEGMVGHVGFADPFDEKLGAVVRKLGHSLEGDNVRLHDKGTIICMGAYNTEEQKRWWKRNKANDKHNRGPSILHSRRVTHVPLLGRQRHQHVCPPRSQVG